MPHAGRAHFMNQQARWRQVGLRIDVRQARRFHHLAGVLGHGVDHRELVVPVLTIYMKQRNTPLVSARIVQPGAVSRIRQHFPEALDRELPGPRLAQCALQVDANARVCRAALPVKAFCAALVSKTANEALVLLRDIPESGHVAFIGPASRVVLVFVAVKQARRHRSANVVHQEATQGAAVVTEPVRETLGSRIKQNLGRAQR